MPAIGNPFTDDYIDNAIERMREVLRDLRTVSDETTAAQVREGARIKLTEAARVFKELRDEFDDLIAETQMMREELVESRQWDRRYRLLQGSIEDVLRGIVDLEELRALAREYAERKMTPQGATT